jgi:sterol desaturase/sphingolipid hydroxylase (fatty acid hydroxylase superfamily)
VKRERKGREVEVNQKRPIVVEGRASCQGRLSDPTRRLPSAWTQQLLASLIFTGVAYYFLHPTLHMLRFCAFHARHSGDLVSMPASTFYHSFVTCLLILLPPVVPSILMGAQITVLVATFAVLQLYALVGENAFVFPNPLLL